MTGRAARPLALLRRLERVKTEFGATAPARKRELLAELERRPLPRAADVLRLHEILCFLRAYPDDAAVLALVERMLAAFARRPDLRKHREQLADTGIAGTPIDYRFFAPTASWLAARWGERLRVDWRRFRSQSRLERWLPILTLYSETPGIDEYAFDPHEWMRRLKGPDETDAAFIIRRFDALRVDPFVREKLYDELEPPLRLTPGEDTPSRSRARHPGLPVIYQTKPLSRSRPSLREEIRRPPRAVRSVPPREARALIDLAREAMVTRSRDLDVFSWADSGDVRLIDCGGGLQFACIGAIRERRLLLEAVYGFLTLRNGVPIGYVLCSALFGSSEIAYNVFETYRGAEAAMVYARVLAMVHHLFGSNAFAIDPYQLGRDNEEAIRSGAWWFYRKLGFQPLDRLARGVMRRELARMRTDSRHRSSPETLRRLARSSLFFWQGRARRDILGLLSLADVGLAISRSLADRFGSNREEAERVSVREAARLLGLRSPGDFSAGERLAWRCWSPLIVILPGVEHWTGAEKRALVEVVKAKGGPRESEFVRRFDAHQPLRDAVRKLAVDAED